METVVRSFIQDNYFQSIQRAIENGERPRRVEGQGVDMVKLFEHLVVFNQEVECFDLRTVGGVSASFEGLLWFVENAEELGKEKQADELLSRVGRMFETDEWLDLGVLGFGVMVEMRLLGMGEEAKKEIELRRILTGLEKEVIDEYNRLTGDQASSIFQVSDGVDVLGEIKRGVNLSLDEEIDYQLKLAIANFVDREKSDWEKALEKYETVLEMVFDWELGKGKENMSEVFELWDKALTLFSSSESMMGTLIKKGIRERDEGFLVEVEERYMKRWLHEEKLSYLKERIRTVYRIAINVVTIFDGSIPELSGRIEEMLGEQVSEY